MMSTTEAAFLFLNSVIAFGVLLIAIKQRKDSRQGSLVGVISLIKSMQEKEQERLQTFISIANKPELIKKMPEDVRISEFAEAEKLLGTLHKLNFSYNELIKRLDNELNQKGVLERAIRIQKDTDHDKTLEMFKNAYKL